MSDQKIPTTLDELNIDWLNEVLRESPWFAGSRIAGLRFDPIGDETGFTGQVGRLHLEFDPAGEDAPRSLIVKVPNPVQERRTNLFNMFVREYLFYREAAAHVNLNVPALYFGLVDAESESGVLLLEDLHGESEHAEMDQLSIASLSLDALGRFHAAWWDSPGLNAFDWLPSIDRGIQEIEKIFPQYWRSFKKRMQTHLTPEAIRLGDSLRASFRRIRAALAQPPQTFLHGDFQTNNLLFRQNGALPELYVIDWQVCRRGRAMRDVAHFMGLSLDTDLRRTHEEALLAHYYQSLLDNGVTGYSFDQALEDYRTSLLDLFYFLVVISLFLDFSKNPQLLDTVVGRVCAITLDHHASP